MDGKSLDPIQPANPQSGTQMDESSQVSKFLHIKVHQPLTPETVVEAVGKALETRTVLPTFHESQPVGNIAAEAKEEGQPDNAAGKDSLLMLVQSEGPW